MKKYIPIIVILIGLAACNQQQMQNVATVACTVDKLAPAAIAAGGTIAVITDPTQADTIAKLNASEAALHPIVVAACNATLAGSVPVAGTVATSLVPVAAPQPIISTTAITFPTTPVAPATK